MADDGGELAKSSRHMLSCKLNPPRLSVAFRFLHWIRSKIYQTRHVDGMSVLAFETANLDRVEAALNVIRDYDPIRHRRLVRDLRHIWVWQVPGTVARFRVAEWTCDLDEQFVETSAPELIASTIVHEATHARLDRMGFGYEEAIRERVEHLCLRREVAFAKKVPGGIEGQWAEASLNALWDLSDEGFAQRRDEDYRAVFLRNGTPRWLVNFIIMTGSWLNRRRVARKKAPGSRFPEDRK